MYTVSVKEHYTGYDYMHSFTTTNPMVALMWIVGKLTWRAVMGRRDWTIMDVL